VFRKTAYRPRGLAQERMLTGNRIVNRPRCSETAPYMLRASWITLYARNVNKRRDPPSPHTLCQCPALAEHTMKISECLEPIFISRALIERFLALAFRTGLSEGPSSNMSAWGGSTQCATSGRGGVAPHILQFVRWTLSGQLDAPARWAPTPV
jgi:hypothetical protein